MASPFTPRERLARLHAATPDCTKLARGLSLCVRAEPELVRQIRLILFPGAGAWLEADLYFSSLVAQRTPDWILLDPQLSLELQEELAQLIENGANVRDGIARVRKVVQHAHSSAPFEIAFEEELIWLAVERPGGVDQARRAIHEKLQSVFMRMLQRSEESIAIARWFASATRRMPSLARDPGIRSSRVCGKQHARWPNN